MVAMIWMRVLFCSFCVLAVALALQLVFSDKGVMEYVSLCRTHDRLSAQIDAVTRRNLELSDEIRLLRKSPAYGERMARAEFNFAADDEILYLFEPSQAKDQLSGQRE